MNDGLAIAIRLAERALDEARAALAEGDERLACLDGRLAAARASLAMERGRASAATSLPPTGYFERARAVLSALGQEREGMERRTTALREQVRACAAQHRALERLEEERRQVAKRRVEALAQAAADDRAAVAFLSRRTSR